MRSHFYIKDNNIWDYVSDINLQVLGFPAVLTFCLLVLQGYFMQSTLLWCIILLSADFVERIHGFKFPCSTKSSRSRIWYHNQALCIKQLQNSKTYFKEMEYVKLKN